jgi:hypothetical protein
MFVLHPIALGTEVVHGTTALAATHSGNSSLPDRVLRGIQILPFPGNETRRNTPLKKLPGA